MGKSCTTITFVSRQKDIYIVSIAPHKIMYISNTCVWQFIDVKCLSEDIERPGILLFRQATWLCPSLAENKMSSQNIFIRLQLMLLEASYVVLVAETANLLKSTSGGFRHSGKTT